MTRNKSEKLFAEALKYIPGGVNSPVRAFRAVGGNPFFVSNASGARVWDVDGNELIDYVGTWGPAILGHAHPKSPHDQFRHGGVHERNPAGARVHEARQDH